MTNSIIQIVTAVRDGSKTALEHVEEAFVRASANNQHHALLSFTKERAIRRAKEIDDKVRLKQPIGKLTGVPFVVKDNFLAFGAPTTAASKILENFQAPLQATAVEKLEAEGAICIGKANLDAFAHGSSTENSAFGTTRNAFDEQRVAGGSSGGSAVVTALDIVPFALGSDTGGSIRQPASFNGVYGMKPTYGMVSRYGVVAMASSTDTIGCFAKTADETALVMSIMAGIDKKDMTTIDATIDLPLTEVKPLTVGVLDDTLTDNVSPDVLKTVNYYIERLETAGHTIKHVTLPIAKYALAIYYIVVPAEISSNLARYDGIRYGYRNTAATTLAELYGRSRNDGFMTENKRRIMIGSYVLSSGFYDAYYQQAQKARTLLIKAYDKLFEACDVLVCPVAPTTAFKIGENEGNPIKMYLSDIMTVPPSLAGLPALSVPVGFDSDGLPIGVQLIGRQRSDSQLLSLAKAMEARL